MRPGWHRAIVPRGSPRRAVGPTSGRTAPRGWPCVTALPAPRPVPGSGHHAVHDDLHPTTPCGDRGPAAARRSAPPGPAPGPAPRAQAGARVRVLAGVRRGRARPVGDPRPARGRAPRRARPRRGRRRGRGRAVPAAPRVRRRRRPRAHRTAFLRAQRGVPAPAQRLGRIGGRHGRAAHRGVEPARRGRAGRVGAHRRRRVPPPLRHRPVDLLRGQPGGGSPLPPLDAGAQPPRRGAPARRPRPPGGRHGRRRGRRVGGAAGRGAGRAPAPARRPLRPAPGRRGRPRRPAAGRRRRPVRRRGRGLPGRRAARRRCLPAAPGDPQPDRRAARARAGGAAPRHARAGPAPRPRHRRPRAGLGAGVGVPRPADAGGQRGRERTRAEFDRLLTAGGFRLRDVVRTAAPTCVITAEPVGAADGATLPHPGADG